MSLLSLLKCSFFFSISQFLVVTFFFTLPYSRCVKQPMCFLLNPIKPKNPSPLIQNRQGCGLVAKNTEESHRTSGSIKGRAEEEEKK